MNNTQNNIKENKNFNQSSFDLESSFSNVIKLFNQYQQAVEEKEYGLKRAIELKEKDIKSVIQSNQLLLESMQQVTIMPDDHVFSIHINDLKKKASELLDEAISFREYSQSLLAKYKFRK